MDNSSVNIDLIRDHVDTIILTTLSERDKYGLEILSEIKEKSNGLYELKQPTLYSCLKRLEKLGYISSYKGDSSNGAQRVYYTLLQDGRNYLLQDQVQWEYARTIIDNLVSDKKFDPNNKKPFEASDLRPRTKRTPKDEIPPALIPQQNTTSSVIEQEDTSSIVEYKTSGIPEQTNMFDSGMKIEEYSTSNEPQNFIFDKNASYVEVLGSIFNNDAPVEDNKPQYKSSAAYNDYQNYNEIQQNSSYYKYTFGNMQKLMSNDGFTLKPYLKKNTTDYYANNYYYSNKVLSLTGWISYLIFFVTLLIMHFSTASMLGTDNKYLWIAEGCVFIIPLTLTVLYFINPTKRISANFSLKKTLSLSLILIINAMLIVLIIGFLAYHANFTQPQTLIKPVVFPLILLALIPVYIIVYSSIYRTLRFHVN